jgi:hypothetical protein
MNRYARASLLLACGWLLVKPPLTRDNEGDPPLYTVQVKLPVAEWEQVSVHDDARSCGRAERRFGSVSISLPHCRLTERAGTMDGGARQLRQTPRSTWLGGWRSAFPPTTSIRQE